MTPAVEKAIVESGVILLKYWLEVTPEEQTARLKDRIDDGRKLWKLTPMDLKSYSRWFDYSVARDDMFKATDSSWAPWFAVHSNDKRRARLSVISHILASIPFKQQPRAKIVLPKRQARGAYRESNYPFKFIAEVS
jgi:polyphosphate kinase 2 (PPK2 family)